MNTIRDLLRSRVLPWAALFVVLGALGVQIGGTNAVARIAGLRAFTEEGSLNIDHYHDWSDDWSRAPSGHYYPDKAPGGVLFGIPAFFVIDFPFRQFAGEPRDNQGRAAPPGLPELFLLCFVMQLLPFSLLVLHISRKCEGLFGGDLPAHFFALAALFGNTAALYMNTYFGHGLAALLTLSGFFAWLRGRYGTASAFLAASLLTDYGTGLVVPFFLAATLWRERSWRPLGKISLAALPFALIWIWYHTVAFGSPFALSTKFCNPDLIEPVSGASLLEGMYGLVPSPRVFAKLLFGPERGILYTQPWLLAIFPLLFARTHLPRGTKLFLMGSLLALLWMNSSIGGWHGGWGVGPRYLCLLFPSIALVLALAWRDLSQLWHALLWIGLAVALAFRVLTFPFSPLAPAESLWGYFIDLYRLGTESPDAVPLLIAAICGFLLAGIWAWYLYGRSSAGTAGPASGPKQVS
jgi:hypothetical protein